jgi:hypothetical protein
MGYISCMPIAVVLDSHRIVWAKYHQSEHSFMNPIQIWDAQEWYAVSASLLAPVVLLL